MFQCFWDNNSVLLEDWSTFKDEVVPEGPVFQKCCQVLFSVFWPSSVYCVLQQGLLLGQLLMPLLPVLCLLFSCLSLWSWCCGVPFLFSVKHTLNRASATRIVFLGLYLTWMSNFRYFSMNHWNLDKVRDWFFSKICSSGA